MTQENYEDYYEKEYGIGCCLRCSTSYKGCLCLRCKCKKCYWYSSPSDLNEKGHCDKTDDLIEENKNKVKRYYDEQEKIKYEMSLILKARNEKLEAEIRAKGKFPNTYTCQRCNRWFVVEEDLIIIQSKEPLCPICKGEIKIEDVKDGNTDT